MNNEILITTLHDIPGVELKLKDIVYEVVEGTNIEELIAKMKEKAKAKKLNGVLGFRITSIVEDGKVKLVGYGTGFEIIKSQWAVY